MDIGAIEVLQLLFLLIIISSHIYSQSRTSATNVKASHDYLSCDYAYKEPLTGCSRVQLAKEKDDQCKARESRSNHLLTGKALVSLSSSRSCEQKSWTAQPDI